MDFMLLLSFPSKVLLSISMIFVLLDMLAVMFDADKSRTLSLRHLMLEFMVVDLDSPYVLNKLI
jgi:hypothetical protein